ncbi:MAG: hypothetical protein WC532_00225 [Candidatus Omnitrophota bacterium]
MKNPDFNVENDKIFKYFVEQMGPANYEIFNSEEPMPFVVAQPPYRGFYTCISTSATIDIKTVSYRNLELAPDAPVVVMRNMRYCDHNDKPHLNSDDTVFFAHKSGRIGRVVRKDAEDHYKEIAKIGGLEHIAEAFHLPKETSGPISQYVENGASVPIRIDCPPKDKIAFIVDLTKKSFKVVRKE